MVGIYQRSSLSMKNCTGYQSCSVFYSVIQYEMNEFSSESVQNRKRKSLFLLLPLLLIIVVVFYNETQNFTHLCFQTIHNVNIFSFCPFISIERYQCQKCWFCNLYYLLSSKYMICFFFLYTGVFLFI